MVLFKCFENSSTSFYLDNIGILNEVYSDKIYFLKFVILNYNRAKLKIMFLVIFNLLY